MGYRSQIAIAVDPSVYDNAPDQVKKTFQEVFEENQIKESERIVFFHYSVKWYPSYPDVAIIENWLESLEDNEYALMELGEDYSDVRMSGDCFEYGLDFVRKIEFE